jgi:plasmid stabilization system protein ParE
MPKYHMSDEARRRLDKIFTYHQPKDDQPARYVMLRDKAKELAIMICEEVRDSREQSMALTKLEECVMHANSGIARNE